MTNKEAQNEIVRNKGVFKYDTTMTEALNLAIKALEKDRPTGKWIDNQNNSGGGINCSICGKMLPCTDEYWYETDYCPNCGARMEAENE